ncbi:MAG: glycosyltransferase family 4 protein [Planctomycetes bacterium]|nr:glycosyltransferase family 4 protein [Planctomycetota bacterium]
MHIAIVRTEFIRTRGGAERYAVDLARQWVSQGHRISVVCHRHDARDAEGMEIVPVSRPKVLGPFKHSWFAKRAGKAAGECSADAVLCLARAYPGDVLRLGDGLHQMWLETRYGKEGAKRRAKLNPRHRELLSLEKGLFKPGRFGLYVANSEMIREQVIERFKLEPGGIIVIQNGVDWARFNTGVREDRDAWRSSHGIPTDKKLVLFSGMDFRRKGLMQAVTGFIKLAQSRNDVYFACVGPGYTGTAEEMLAKTTPGRSSFIEQTEDIARWYGAADVFVLPTMHDPSANAVTESLACGTPVITSAENGAKQHIRDGANGYVLQNRTDVDELAMRLDQVLNATPVPDAVVDSASLLSREINADRMLEALKMAAAKRT